MDIKSVKCVYPGRSGSSKRIASAVGNVISDNVFCTDPKGRAELSSLCGSGDVLVAVLPVKRGRLTRPALSLLRALKGSGEAAIAIALSGEEGCGSALSELTEALGKAGFSVVGAAAFIEDGCLRPDDADFSRLVEFATACSRRLEDSCGCCRAPKLPEIPAVSQSAVRGGFAALIGRLFSAGAEKEGAARLEPVWYV